MYHGRSTMILLRLLAISWISIEAGGLSSNSSSSSVCPSPDDDVPCTNDENYAICRELEDGGCRTIAVMESCPLQYACGDDVFDLTDESASRFFDASNLAAYVANDGGDEVPHVTATTPLPTACGAAVKTTLDDEAWGLHFSSAMDPGVPSVDHDVALAGGFEGGFVRFFAFVPFGRGVYVSALYRLTLTGEANVTLEEVPLGNSAYSDGSCIDVKIGIIEVCRCVTDSPPCGLCHVVDLDKEEDCDAEFPVDAVPSSTSSIGLEVSTGEDSPSAAVFFYAPEEDALASFKTNHSSFGGPWHGIQRADDIAVHPVGTIGGLDAGASYVVGATWIDSSLTVHHATRVTASTAPDNGNDGPVNETACESSATTSNVALLSLGAAVAGVSSNYGGGPNDSSFGANNAIDGASATQWSSNGDGNGAWISLRLPFPTDVVGVGFWTRTMGSSAQISAYDVLVDGTVIGSCEVADAARLYACNVSATNATEIMFDVTASSGGNTGAKTIEVYGCATSSDGGNSSSEVPTISPSAYPSDVPSNSPSGVFPPSTSTSPKRSVTAVFLAGWLSAIFMYLFFGA